MLPESLPKLTKIGDFVSMSEHTQERKPLTWRTPGSRQEAVDRARLLLDEIGRIDVQLSSTSQESFLAKRRNKDGSPTTAADYESWRKRAKQARGAKMSEYRFLKNWLASNPPTPTRNWLKEVMECLDHLFSTNDEHSDEAMVTLMDIHKEYRAQRVEKPLSS